MDDRRLPSNEESFATICDCSGRWMGKRRTFGATSKTHRSGRSGVLRRLFRGLVWQQRDAKSKKKNGQRKGREGKKGGKNQIFRWKDQYNRMHLQICRINAYSAVAARKTRLHADDRSRFDETNGAIDSHARIDYDSVDRLFTSGWGRLAVNVVEIGTIDFPRIDDFRGWLEFLISPFTGEWFSLDSPRIFDVGE